MDRATATRKVSEAAFRVGQAQRALEDAEADFKKAMIELETAGATEADVICNLLARAAEK